LAETFPLRLTDTPAYLNFPGEAGAVRYGEGLYIGYRYYDARQIAVQFPFGYGLSYTTFEYSNPRLSSPAFRDVDGVRVSVDVTNRGDRAGKETVQVYVRDRLSGLPRPEKELKGFAKVTLEPGETKTVTIDLDFRAFAFFHPAYRRWVTEDGAFDILIGASAADIRATLHAELTSTLELPSLLNVESTIGHWMNDPRGAKVIDPLVSLMRQQGGGLFAQDDGALAGIDPMIFLKDMPLLSVLHFQESAVGQSPEELVNTLLQMVHADSTQ
jgi:beta-glucosidase